MWKVRDRTWSARQKSGLQSTIKMKIIWQVWLNTKKMDRNKQHQEQFLIDLKGEYQKAL